MIATHRENMENREFHNSGKHRENLGNLGKRCGKNNFVFN